MNQDPRYEQWREAGWRRELTPAEAAELRAWLSEHADAQADWEAEVSLSQALRRLPPVPVASNFTARVLQGIDREEARDRRQLSSKVSHWLHLRWVPRLAATALAISAALLTYHHGRAVQRSEAAHSLAAVSDVSLLPGPDVLQDFDAIRAMNPAPGPDEQLLVLMQ